MHCLKALNAGWLCLIAALAGCATSQVQTRDTIGIVESYDGVPIAYESFGEGDTAVVFIHCWACNRAFWRHQVDPVVEAGYQVVTLDLPGHGESGANREHWSFSGLAADLEAVIDALELKRVILVGHATGGRAALAAVPRMPDRVIGIACVDALRYAELEWPDGISESLAELVNEDFHEVLQSLISPVLRPGTDPELAEWIFTQSAASDQAAVVALLADLPKTDLAAELTATSIPIRCINAAPEGAYSKPTQIEINRKYSDFDAILMEGVGHYLQLEQPEVFNKLLLDLLAELDSQD